MSVGKRLKEERTRLGLSQEAFGKHGGVGKGAQINYESDSRSPDCDYLAGIDSIGVDVLYVVVGKRRIDMAQTDTERELLQSAIDYVMQTKAGALLSGNNSKEAMSRIGHMVQERYDDSYERAAAQSMHPGKALDDRARALLQCFEQANEDGRKVIERIASMEAQREGLSLPKGIKIKGSANTVGSGNTIGDISINDSSGKPKRKT